MDATRPESPPPATTEEPVADDAASRETSQTREGEVPADESGGRVGGYFVNLDYAPHMLSTCPTCGADMFEMKNYRKPAEHGRVCFLCLERTCGARWYLDFGNLVEMRRDG